MKKTKTFYWILTLLFAGFMIFSAVPDALATEDAVKIVHDFPGYPVYIISFFGIAKFPGALVVLIPGLNRIKEWAYAGLMIDLLGATYSMIATGAAFMQWSFMILPVTVGALSYIYHHKKLKAASLSWLQKTVKPIV
jgi:hypothetical protein